MGGKRETEVPTKKEDFTVGTLRVHEAGGAVHFHCDDRELKVAVPVPCWFRNWERLRAEMGLWKFHDPENKTVLELSVWQTSQGPITAYVGISEAAVTPEFAALDKFTNG